MIQAENAENILFVFVIFAKLKSANSGASREEESACNKRNRVPQVGKIPSSDLLLIVEFDFMGAPS